jgi:hypothetical protein
MPKTHIWQLRALLYMAAPLITFAGLLVIDSPVLAAIGLFIGLLAYLALDRTRLTQQGNTDVERTDHS